MNALKLAFALTAIAAATSAFAESRTLDLAPFSSIEITSGITADVTVGGAQSVVVEAPTADVLDKLRVRVSGDRLSAGIDWSIFDLFTTNKRDISIHITLPAVTALESSSGADITAAGIVGDKLTFVASSGADLTAAAVKGGAFRVEASSGATIALDGTCTEIRLELSSGADLAAENLLCGDLDAEVSSGAHGRLHIDGDVKAEASSGASLLLRGTPKSLQQDISSGGDIDVQP